MFDVPARFQQELESALVRLKSASEQVSDWQPLMRALRPSPTAARGNERAEDVTFRAAVAHGAARMQIVPRVRNAC